jgi:hypothetical protein
MAFEFKRKDSGCGRVDLILGRLFCEELSKPKSRSMEINMMEPFAYSETDRTKSKWIAKVYQDFVERTGRSRTTQRALFYHALQMTDSDYPICGGFVGEIRITRPYHENDGEKMPKWTGKAKTLGFIPEDAILDEIPGEHIFPADTFLDRPYSFEVWLNKSSLNPLLYPICQRHGATLVFVDGKVSENAVLALCQRCNRPTIILCLSDISPASVFFCRDLAVKIARCSPAKKDMDIKLKCIGLRPEQVLELKLPAVRVSIKSKEAREKYARHLKSQNMNPKDMVELDALEVYYPGGIAGFLDEILSKYSHSFDPNNELWMLDLKKGVIPQA